MMTTAGPCASERNIMGCSLAVVGMIYYSHAVTKQQQQQQQAAGAPAPDAAQASAAASGPNKV